MVQQFYVIEYFAPSEDRKKRVERTFNSSEAAIQFAKKSFRRGIDVAILYVTEDCVDNLVI